MRRAVFVNLKQSTSGSEGVAERGGGGGRHNVYGESGAQYGAKEV